MTEHYQVYQNETLIGSLKKSEGDDYILNAGKLNGTGTFDDFGNFNYCSFSNVGGCDIEF